MQKIRAAVIKFVHLVYSPVALCIQIRKTSSSEQLGLVSVLNFHSRSFSKVLLGYDGCMSVILSRGARFRIEELFDRYSAITLFS